ncbi:hypothetical protein DD238_004166 [Peronospora effusa]|uniref:Uncharacterized protein n=1 Tax=Peronospora effusa TaxID=542832 RepID=A0A3M6VR93_9STRA|nr:hypothetical protein DD238_004166 [Peronospora effusa]
MEDEESDDAQAHELIGQRTGLKTKREGTIHFSTSFPRNLTKGIGTTKRRFELTDWSRKEQDDKLR